MRPIIIAFGYRARSGKDTAGAYLVDKWNFQRIGFADKLKKVVGVLFDVDPWEDGFKDTMLSCGLTGGQALQQIGVKLREVHPNIWIEASAVGAYALMHDALIVVTDCRFKNEAAAVKRLGGYLVEIRRPGLASDNHSSETEGRDIRWDYTIWNNGTIADLHQRLDELVAGIHAGVVDTPPAPQAPAHSS
jgi:hypothetical protein